jgi:hypothetical protein
MLTLVGVASLPHPARAQSDPCALVQAEVDAILASTADDAQTLQARADQYAAACSDSFSDSDLVTIYGYDAANADDLQRWQQYGLAFETGKIVGKGDDAYFQLTIPAPSEKSFVGLLHSHGLELDNTASFTYEGTPYPIMIVPLPAGDRALPLIKRGRQSSQFYDPVSGDLIDWQGNWRKLSPVVNPAIALDFSFRLRLDTPESFVRAYIGSFANSNQVAVEIRAESFSLQTPTETIDHPVESSVGVWHTLWMLIRSNQIIVYADDAPIHEYGLDNFVISTALLGFQTSAAPATISLDDIEVKTNWQQ